jgi:hypothetical protein
LAKDGHAREMRELLGLLPDVGLRAFAIGLVDDDPGRTRAGRPRMARKCSVARISSVVTCQRHKAQILRQCGKHKVLLRLLQRVLDAAPMPPPLQQQRGGEPGE